MSHLAHWLFMGGYARYVWSAYGLVGVVLGISLISLKCQRIQTHKKLQRWFKKYPI